MSDKKKQTKEDGEQVISEIEIVTMGVKLNSTPAQQTPAKENSAQRIQREEAILSNHVLGEPEVEECIREHVADIQEIIHHQKLEDLAEAELDAQAEDSQSADANEESNVNDESQSSKNNKKEQKSPCESNQQRKEEVPTSRKCFNKLCTSKKIYKKIRSRVQENKYRFFCKNCYENYFNNLYCQFCQQIYSNNCQNEDDDKWIGCDHCERWNHIECEKKYRQKNINDLKDKNLLYQCLVCSQKTKITYDKTKKGDKEQVEEKLPNKQKIEINKDQRILIFHKKNETFPNLEYFLQNYSFRLWMNESQIREDVQHLRNVCCRVPQQENLKNKFKKVKTE